jgi:peptide/nickel transport system permease protein
MNKGEQDFCVAGTSMEAFDAGKGLYDFFHTNSIGSTTNRTYLASPDVDAILNDIVVETDSEERARLVYEVQKVIHEECPMIVICYQHKLVVCARTSVALSSWRPVTTISTSCTSQNRSRYGSMSRVGSVEGRNSRPTHSTRGQVRGARRNTMAKYILRRVLMMIPVMIGVILIVFTLMYITPGDPVDILLGDEATPETKEALRKQLGLEGGYLERFSRYCLNLLKGDLGICYSTRQPVSARIAQTFPYTVRLAISGCLVAVSLGLVVGVVSAVKQYSVFDQVSMIVCMVGFSMSSFWLGLLLMLLFSLKLGWLPASGFTSLKQMILPSLTVGLHTAASIARMTRSSMLEVIRQDYITTARAKGQREFIVILRHALRNALIPVTTVIGMQFGHLLGGSVLVESIFSVPGIGKMMIDSIKQRNYPVVQAGVLTIALAFSLVNLLVDIAYAYFDPRIRSQYK